MLEDEAMAKDYCLTIQRIAASFRKAVVIINIYGNVAIPWAMFQEANGKPLSGYLWLIGEHKVPFLDKPCELILCHDHIVNGIYKAILLNMKNIRERLVQRDSITPWTSAHFAKSSHSRLLNTENYSATNNSCPPS
jgi:hypothetical protein